jgi:GNAT superfamily N-acetyltransferase
MSLEYRLMQESDLDVARRLDRDSFGALFHELTGQPDTLAPREPEFFAHWLRTDPGGAWVAELAGELVGVNFNHARGRNAWIGPLAMKPGVQLRGGGRTLCEKGIEYLEAQGCSCLGLDTYANNPVSVSLYLKLGFEITGGTLLLRRAVREEFPPADCRLRALLATEADLPELVRLDESESGFCRKPDFWFALEWEGATALRLCDHEDALVGMLVCYQKRGTGLLGSLYLSESAFARGGLTALLAAARDFCLARGLPEMQLTLMANDLRLTDALFGLGFQTRVAMVRMTRIRKDRRGSVRGPLCSEKG